MLAFVRSQNWMHRDVLEGTGGVLIPIVQSRVDLAVVLQLNETGNFIWNFLSSPRSLDEICGELLRQFDCEDGGSEVAEGGSCGLSGDEDRFRLQVFAEVEEYLAEMVKSGSIVRI